MKIEPVDVVGVSFIAAFVALIIYLFAVLLPSYNYKRGACAAAGGVFLKSEEVCVKLEIIKTESK
jgi:NADH:ubiquinone oxidoreductase subunit B-like Fe-S oxidoreductase